MKVLELVLAIVGGLCLAGSGLVLLVIAAVAAGDALRERRHRIDSERPLGQ